MRKKTKEKQSQNLISHSDRASLAHRLRADSKRERKIQFYCFSPLLNHAEESEDIMIIHLYIIAKNSKNS